MKLEESNNLSIESEQLLIVEGQDEKGFFATLLKYLDINTVQIINVAGRENLKNTLESLSIITNFDKVTHIGFVFDAEKNEAKSTFQSFESNLKKIFPAECIPKKSGDVVKAEIACGIFIMPDNKRSGMLEDLCLDSVRHTTLFPIANSYVQNARMLQSESDKEKYNIHKALLQTYLAGLPNLCNSIRVAVAKGVFNFENNAFGEIKDFLTKLYL